ncbi:MAG: aminopeptidase [Sedimenticola sp.]|nr:aminopeptidase [Sedimenticola sp.]
MTTLFPKRYLNLLLLCLLLPGCTTLSYYSQSIGGHLQLMGQRQPINQLLQDPETPAELKRRLENVQQIRDFASAELGLPENDSYRSYAALNRSAVVWSVVATPAFSTQPKQWCYLVIGCASYRGYFSRQDAEAYAAELRQQGLDVAIESVPAYSTLGWFDDPLPSTIINWSEPRTAGLIFHELAHQQLYVEDDSAFNEAFASLVEEEGIIRWLERRDAEAILQWQNSQRYEQAFIALLLSTREQLQRLYDQSLDDEEKREQKVALFDALQEQYQTLKRDEWGGYSGFDGWFGRELNNAHLASVATYEEWKPVFRQLLTDAGGDFSVFYQRSEALSRLPYAIRVEKMNALREAQAAGQ